MSDVFVSYKREDEVRVGRLVHALEAQGLRVWWDRELPGGESWRRQIEDALAAAKCAVVVWTHASVGPAGSFVRDEAGRAARDHRLVPVLLDTVDPPLGFGELQAIDLTRWRGKASDPFFQDLVAAVRAKIAGTPVPKPRGPIARLRRRLTWGSVATAATAFVAAFASNTLQLQNHLCALPLGQPGLSDACGAVGLGGRPARAERLAWAARTPGRCDDLRKHLEAWPGGHYRDQAQALLSARRIVTDERWQPAANASPLRVVVSRDASPSRDEAQARAAALERGRAKADAMCRDFDAAGITRLRSVDVEPQEWMCDHAAGGTICGFEGKALCRQDERVKTQSETCAEGRAP